MKELEEKEVEKVLVGQATEEQIQAWKKEHGTVYAIIVDGKVCYLKKPGRKEMSYAASIGISDPMGMVEGILTTCFIGGCEDFKTDDDLFLAAASQLEHITETKQAELVKL